MFSIQRCSALRTQHATCSIFLTASFFSIEHTTRQRHCIRHDPQRRDTLHTSRLFRDYVLPLRPRLNPNERTMHAHTRKLRTSLGQQNDSRFPRNDSICLYPPITFRDLSCVLPLASSFHPPLSAVFNSHRVALCCSTPFSPFCSELRFTCIYERLAGSLIMVGDEVDDRNL